MKNHTKNCNSSGRSVLECDCDGYHTFGELYEHRIMLYVALCRKLCLVTDRINEEPVYAIWRSKRHSDGELAFGGIWFVLGIGREKGRQITYHLPIARWDECAFAETLDRVPEFDGHTSDDVLARLKTL